MNERGMEMNRHYLPIAFQIRLIVAIAQAIIISTSGCTSSESPYDRHFDQPLPKGVRFLHYKECRSGWSDWSYAFVFADEKQLLKDQLIEVWNLKRVRGATSAGALDSLSLDWWPTRDDRSRMESYGWEDDETEEYKSVWFDKESGLLYAEYGHW